MTEFPPIIEKAIKAYTFPDERALAGIDYELCRKVVEKNGPEYLRKACWDDCLGSKSYSAQIADEVCTITGISVNELGQAVMILCREVPVFAYHHDYTESYNEAAKLALFIRDRAQEPQLQPVSDVPQGYASDW